MVRVVLHYEGQAIPLPPGDTVIGRALECRIRFNDPAVSRMHLRLVVREGGVLAQNLSSSNGTLINGVEMREPRPLVDGDVLRIGYRKLRVELGQELRGRKPSLPPTVTLARELEPGSGIMVDDEDAAGEATRPGGLIGDGPGAISLAQTLAEAREQTCPSCRARCSNDAETCPRCGYVWPVGRPTSRTQEIKIDAVTLRAHTRYAVEVPVVYSSETLGIDALVRDLSRGGMFIATDLLEAIGTVCEVTALPDGHAAVRFAGVVAHVVQQANAHGRPPGLGIRFTWASDEADAWLDQVVAGFERLASGAGAEADETVDVAVDDDPTEFDH